MNNLTRSRDTSPLLLQFLHDERGIVASAELMIILTVGVLAIVTGVSSVASAVNFEYADIANAITSLDQSYKIGGHTVAASGGRVHAYNHGMGYNDSGHVFTAQTTDSAVAGVQEYALIEESALLVEELADAELEVVVESEAELEQRLALLEAEAARLEQQAQAQSLQPAVDTCPLEELRQMECRIRDLRLRLEQQHLFDCDRPEQRRAVPTEVPADTAPAPTVEEITVEP